ncbi:Phosphoinositide phosphatase SAC6 [Morella rubra]|uniref:non-specific serine/threonine protein kinase n=1 Tax=Morella rubra TaxID=262757 RepID=A0A6A1UQI7_9ROSI|nr:Phosphoinositide phosphatase SAC6 [Morella rubra]
MWRRGADSDGYVANFVETEQIVQINGFCAAFVQVRGSIPLLWDQIVDLTYKPKFEIVRLEEAPRVVERHFLDLRKKYGAVLAVDLVNKHGGEGRLNEKFANAMQHIVSDDVRYLHFDFHRICGPVHYERLSILYEQISDFLERNGYLLLNEKGEKMKEQLGVVRTNCIDCLDRTNVTQSMIGRKMLEFQLRRLGVFGAEETVSSHRNFDEKFKIMWANHGDDISIQYSGTPALKGDFVRYGKRTIQGILKDGWNALARYYLNNFSDGTKQDAIDLLQGHYIVSVSRDMTPSSQKGGLESVASFRLAASLILTGFLLAIMSLKQGISSSKNLGSSSSGTGRSQRSEEASGSLDESYSNGQILEAPNLKEFSFADLKTATKNFKSDSLLGEGGFGKVYKGWMDEKTLIPSKAGTGMVVAIKKLSAESMQGFQEWQSEVNFLGRLSHPNLVRLLGYCWEDKELLLVYEYMQRGSLENHLFRIVLATKCSNLLHLSDVETIEKYVNPAVLEINHTAKISDFGLAKLGPSGGDSHVTTRIMGTYGYAAPEYIATGLRALDTRRPNGQQSLVEWLRPSLSNRRKLKSLMDTRMEGQYSSKAALQAAELALKCLASDPKNRPSMKEVVAALERIEAIKGRPKQSKSNSTAAAHGGNIHDNSSFRPQHHGGFGKVFKGGMDEKTLTPSKFGSGTVVAIEQLNPETMSDLKGKSNYNAKISDFGWAKLGPSGKDSHVTTSSMGTDGYAAPEYVATGNMISLRNLETMLYGKRDNGL